MTKRNDTEIETLTEIDLDTASGGGWAGDATHWATGTTNDSWGGYLAGKAADIAAGVGGALYAATPLGLAYNTASGAYDVYHSLTDPHATWADVGVASGFAVLGVVPGFKAGAEAAEILGTSLGRGILNTGDVVLSGAQTTVKEALKETVAQEVVTEAVHQIGEAVNHDAETSGKPGDTYVPASVGPDGSIVPGHFEHPTDATPNADVNGTASPPAPVDATSGVGGSFDSSGSTVATSGVGTGFDSSGSGMATGGVGGSLDSSGSGMATGGVGSSFDSSGTSFGGGGGFDSGGGGGYGGGGGGGGGGGE